ncbi:MAG: mechanosensitive ion channel [Desulfobacteraceae bacterium]|jgi:small conductance mechanosensitive channel
MITNLAKFTAEISSPVRILAILAIVIALHLIVIAVRRLSRQIMSLKISSNLSKSKTIASLTTSVIVFALYFSAFGLILHELGVSITAYLASASILGLAIGFGSQGLVQDVVNGLTIVFSGLFNVEDMVEIAGQVGIVRNFGMRFTLLENSFGAMVYIPNRTITNVVRYPKGYIRGIADITLPDDAQIANQMEEKVSTIVKSTSEQLSGILVWPPSIEGRMKTESGKAFLRVKFRLWPGRGAPIETIFKQEVVYALKALDPNYQDWMVTVNYEVERKSASL